jgi:hypothetical protein
LQLIEDYQKLPGVDSLTGSKTHSADLLLETVLAALPHTKQKMQKEQSIDFGTIVEYLKQIFKLRERARQIQNPDQEIYSDLLVKTWEAVFQNKLLVSDRVLLSPGRQLIIDLIKSISGLQKTITYLPIILFREFEESNHLYTLK